MFLKKDRDEIKFVLNKLGMKRVSLNQKDKNFVKSYTDNFIKNNPECLDVYNLIYELYSLELRILYLVFLVNDLDLDSSRVKKYRKEITELIYKFSLCNLTLYSDMFSNDGYELYLTRNGNSYMFKILAYDFKNYIVG